MSDEGQSDFIEKLHYAVMGAMLCGALAWAVADSEAGSWFPSGHDESVAIVSQPLPLPPRAVELAGEDLQRSQTQDSRGNTMESMLTIPAELDYDRAVVSRQ